jgi:hypothetical protein
MEDLLRNDSSFDVYTNSDGGNMFSNRILTTMPSEKSSFQVYLGFQGEDKTDDANADTKPPKTQVTFDPEKVAQGVTATAGAISSVGSTIQAFKGDGTKPKSRRKQLKEVCGKRPLTKKNRAGEYDKCVSNYNAGKIGGSLDLKAPDTTIPQVNDTPPPKDNKKMIIIGVVVVAVVVTAFVGYKKGWFGAKA